MQSITIQPAMAGEIPAITDVLFANRGDTSLFQRNEADLRVNLGDFVMARNAQGRIVGCAALHAHTPALAEILSVAVLPELQGRGLGGRLVKECIRTAPARGIARVWLATLKPDYFARFGFVRISRWSLPVRILGIELRRVLQQPAKTWLAALRGAHTFMAKDVRG